MTNFSSSEDTFHLKIIVPCNLDKLTINFGKQTYIIFDVITLLEKDHIESGIFYLFFVFSHIGLGPNISSGNTDVTLIKMINTNSPFCTLKRDQRCSCLSTSHPSVWRASCFNPSLQGSLRAKLHKIVIGYHCLSCTPSSWCNHQTKIEQLTNTCTRRHARCRQVSHLEPCNLPLACLAFINT